MTAIIFSGPTIILLLSSSEGTVLLVKYSASATYETQWQSIVFTTKSLIFRD